MPRTLGGGFPDKAGLIRVNSTRGPGPKRKRKVDRYLRVKNEKMENFLIVLLLFLQH